MMRSYKGMVIGAVVLMLGISVGGTAWDEKRPARIHQHLQEKSRLTCTHDASEFCTHLPIISIETGGQTIEIQRAGIGEYSYQKSSEIIAQVKVLDSQSASSVR